MKSPLLQRNGFWHHLSDARKHLARSTEAMVDPIGVVMPIVRSWQAWMNHPAELMTAGSQMLSDWAQLNGNAWARLNGVAKPAEIEPEWFDQRFANPAWKVEPGWENLMEQYLYWSRAYERLVEETPGMDHAERRKAAFWFKKYANAVAPTNQFWLNPEALRRAVETNGQSLQQGFEYLQTDLREHRLPLTEMSAYEVGKDLAITPGAVVFRNELLEVLHYQATTKRQRAMPIVIVTPWINKFYIVDLTPRQSMVKHLLDAGFDVYVTSWKNPTADMGGITMDDYLSKGIEVAIDTAIQLSGSKQVHAVGYCIGGAALSMWLAIENVRAKAEKREVRVAHWTTFATLVDYHYPGHIEIFIDPASVDYLSGVVRQAGYLDGKSMSAAFRLLRSNSLIWDVAVRRYLYGEVTKPNEVLYWNMDSTRLPAEMYIWYLTSLYLKNRLIVPNALSLCGTPIDLGKITQPLYTVAAEDDHIAPWRSVAHISRLVPAPKRGVLSSSGHIMGIINPPRPDSRRSYRVGDVETTDTLETWESHSTECSGSWWPDWFAWLHERTGKWVAARPVSSTQFQALSPAPGTYVREISEHSAA